MKDSGDQTLEIYIHIPFCIKKCAYCDFLSGPASVSRQNLYLRALTREIRERKDGTGRRVSSVFIGGGTPSVLSGEQLLPVMEAVRETFTVLPEAEITIEANPGTLDREKLAAYRRMGINRLSIGLQSAKDDLLKKLGRIHDYETFVKTWLLAREEGFRNCNVDLMFAIPGQSPEDWQATLRTVAALSPEHISAYSLIVEPGTPFAGMDLALPDEDTEYAMYEDTARILGEYGYRQYEISNYARDGFACRHNIGYWQRKEYLGFGLGAASLFKEVRYRNTVDPDTYSRVWGEDGAVPDRRTAGQYEEVTPLTEPDRMAEFMFLGLRMTEGVSGQAFEQQFGKPLTAVYGPVIDKYRSLGLLAEENGRILLTRPGIHVSNTIMADFLL
ncbi:MAG: oxygen-independent coproporphyrinogen III oxidase [Blautia sp.]|nr:oxygen-independent coproporphyrinogen III oxidase [Blautia sp.]